MTTILCDGNYVVADKLSTCTRTSNNRYVDGSNIQTSYRFGVEDSVKIGKVKGLRIEGDIVKAVAIGGSATDAADFLRDLREYIRISTDKERPHIELPVYLKIRGVFKVPFTARFSILFLTENKQVVILKVSASTRKTRDADGHTYSTEMIRFEKHDFSKGDGGVVGIGSGSVFYTELGPFLRGQTPHILDTYCYCVNRDHQHSSNAFSVYSLELDHLDEKVEFPQGEFEHRLKRFVGALDFTAQVFGNLPRAVRVSDD